MQSSFRYSAKPASRSRANFRLSASTSPERSLTERITGSSGRAPAAPPLFALRRRASPTLTPPAGALHAAPSPPHPCVQTNVPPPALTAPCHSGGTTGSVEAYAIDPSTGELTFLNRQSSGGAVAAQPAVDPSGKYLVCANYGGGNFTVLPIAADGSLEPVSFTYTVESPVGPDTARQDMSHPHSVVYDPAGQFIAAGDLGTDEVVTFKLNTETGELELVRGLTDSLHALNHEAANRLHAIVSLIELGRSEDALDFATAELHLAQSLTDRLIAAAGDPALTALLVGKSAEAAERGIELRVRGELPDLADVASRDLVTLVGNLLDNA